jgi:hypothetical protein
LLELLDIAGIPAVTFFLDVACVLLLLTVLDVARVSVVAEVPTYDENSGFLLAFMLLLAFLNVAGVLLLLTLLDVACVPVIGEFLLLLAFLYVDGILLLLSMLNVAPARIPFDAEFFFCWHSARVELSKCCSRLCCCWSSFYAYHSGFLLAFLLLLTLLDVTPSRLLLSFCCCWRLLEVYRVPFVEEFPKKSFLYYWHSVVVDVSGCCSRPCCCWSSFLYWQF